jgi:hypothetical protein
VQLAGELCHPIISQQGVCMPFAEEILCNLFSLLSLVIQVGSNFYIISNQEMANFFRKVEYSLAFAGPMVSVEIV